MKVQSFETSCICFSLIWYLMDLIILFKKDLNLLSKAYTTCLFHPVSKSTAQKALGSLDGHILWIFLCCDHISTFSVRSVHLYRLTLFSAKALYRAITSSVQHQSGSCNSHKVPTPAASRPAGLHPFPFSRNSLGILESGLHFNIASHLKDGAYLQKCHHR